MSLLLQMLNMGTKVAFENSLVCWGELEGMLPQSSCRLLEETKQVCSLVFRKVTGGDLRSTDCAKFPGLEFLGQKDAN